MSTFDLDIFVADPTLAQFEGCRKADLRVIAGHYNISVPSALGKSEYKAALLLELMKQKVFSLPTSQGLPEGDVPLCEGAGGGGEAAGDAEGEHATIGLDPRGGAISKTAKFEDGVEDPDSEGSVGSGSSSVV